ncbi:hypothetical protein HXY32_04415 [Candidatus Bathyarchaeota archaeon]|nr:hypothetical protein [Candidatus Bathyarchaeota archaeon]
MSFRKYWKRREYLRAAVPKGFHKKLLILDTDVVGQIEYAPAEVSYYPITAENVIVMNCIWVLRKAKGHNFGKILIEDMVKSERDAVGFATIALENHWSPWFQKWQLEKLGFKHLDKMEVSHKKKYKEQIFSIYLMWMLVKKNAKPPRLDKEKMLKGEVFCMAHPLYRPQTCEENVFEAK